MRGERWSGSSHSRSPGADWGDELARLFAASAVVLVPSLYEDFGLPHLEAMRAASWCISSTAVALVEPAESCTLFDVEGLDVDGRASFIRLACAAHERADQVRSDLLPQNRDCVARFSRDATVSVVAAKLARVLASA